MNLLTFLLLMASCGMSLALSGSNDQLIHQLENYAMSGMDKISHCDIFTINIHKGTNSSRYDTQ